MGTDIFLLLQPKELVTDIYTTGEQEKPGDDRFRMKSWFPPSIRMPDREKSYTF